MRPLQPFDPSTATGGSVPGAMLPNGGAMVLYNKSAYELWIYFDNIAVMDLPAWTGRLFQTCERISQVTWTYAQGWTPSGQGGSPSSLVSIELYNPGEAIPETYPVALTRLVSVGNTVSTSVGQQVINDGSPPNTEVVEATPSDQGTSSVIIRNDASGLLKILSAGVLRTILNAVRGNATSGKATIQLGDSGDASILAIYGAILGRQDASIRTVFCDAVSATGDVAGNTATITGAVTATGLDNSGTITNSAANAGIEHGSQSAVNTPFMDWHSSGSANDYDVRIIASGGINGTQGAGTLNLHGRSIQKDIPDSGFGTMRSVQEFIGATDPATYATVNEGDSWDDV